MNEHRFEYFEHTADQGVIGYGDTLEEAMESVACGMFMMMADLASYQPTEERMVQVTGDDEVSVLKAWLKELLFIFEVDRVLPVEFHITGIADGTLTASVGVRHFGDDMQWTGPQIKAITYHHMEVQRLQDSYRVQAIVDV